MTVISLDYDGIIVTDSNQPNSGEIIPDALNPSTDCMIPDFVSLSTHAGLEKPKATSLKT